MEHPVRIELTSLDLLTNHHATQTLAVVAVIYLAKISLVQGQKYRALSENRIHWFDHNNVMRERAIFVVIYWAQINLADHQDTQWGSNSLTMGC